MNTLGYIMLIIALLSMAALYLEFKDWEDLHGDD